MGLAQGVQQRGLPTERASPRFKDTGRTQFGCKAPMRHSHNRQSTFTTCSSLVMSCPCHNSKPIKKEGFKHVYVPGG